jgi:uncharacterized protein Yka (UPF0111/DUF47 family)
MAKIRFDYFDAFERLAGHACNSAAKLHEILRDYTSVGIDDDLAEMHVIENAADEENHQIFNHLASEFITPIEREDIISLAQSLDDINDYIEDVVQRLYMFNVQYVPRSAIEMAVLIEKSTDALNAAMKDFRNFKKSKTLDALLINVNDYEEEADRMYLEAVRDLFINHTDDPMYVMTWNTIFTRMERCCDACETTAMTMGTIIMKNS